MPFRRSGTTDSGTGIGQQYTAISHGYGGGGTTVADIQRSAIIHAGISGCVSGQHIQASAIFQYDIISFTLHNRECSKAVYAGNGCSRTGNQCTARVLGDCSGFPAGMYPQFTVLINGGVTDSTTCLNNLPAPSLITVFSASPSLCTYW